MLRLLSFLIFMQISFGACGVFAKVEVKWFGATCVLISDGESKILFDPFFTRPSLWDVVSFKSLKSDPLVIKKWLSEEDLNKISALVTSHSHYDHALDLVALSKMTTAKIYGSESSKNIALGGGVDSSRVYELKEHAVFEVGKFKLKVLKGEHPPHFLNFMLASGKIKTPLKPGAAAYDYKKGEDYIFLITHPEGKIVFHPSGNSALKDSDLMGFKADLVLQGIANRRGTQDLIDKVVRPVQASLVVPVHHDNIFTPLSDKPGDLPGVRRKKFLTILEEEGFKAKEMSIGEALYL